MVRPGPHFSVLDVHLGWFRAFQELGIDVAEFRLDDRLDFFTQAMLEQDGELRRVFNDEAGIRLAANGLKEACYDFWPDVVIVTSGFFIPPDVLRVVRSRRHRLVALFTESPYEDDRQVERADLFDVVLVNDPTNLQAFRERQWRSYYMPHAYDPGLHRPGPGLPEWACDLAFVGTGYPSRQEFLAACDLDGLDVRLGGNWPQAGAWFTDRLVHPDGYCLDNTETVQLYQSARAGLNLYRKEGSAGADGWAMGPREVELAATGCFFLREPRPESDRVLSMLPTFSEPDEVRPLLDWWLAHDEQRAETAAAARGAVADRTFTANARRLLDLIS